MFQFVVVEAQRVTCLFQARQLVAFLNWFHKHGPLFKTAIIFGIFLLLTKKVYKSSIFVRLAQNVLHVIFFLFIRELYFIRIFRMNLAKKIRIFILK